jgi:hypothetical protein
MDRMEVLLWAVLVLDVLGFGGLIAWLKQRIKALDGTVNAQGNTIDAQGQSLKAAEQTFGMLHKLMETLDVEQWARRYESHSKIVEAEGEAKVEAARRELRRDLEAAKRQGQQTMEWMGKEMDTFTDLIIASLGRLRRSERLALIDGSALPDGMKQIFAKWAASQPDPVDSALSALHEFADRIIASDAGKGGFDVKPPPPIKPPWESNPER